MKNVGGMMKSIMDIQKKMDSIQKEIAEKSFDGSSAGGLVSVTVTGKGEVTKLVIDKEVLSEDAETVSDLVLIALNSANNKKEEFSKEKLASISAGILPLGLKIPGLG